MKNSHFTVYYNFNNLKIRFLELNNRQFSVDAEAFDPYSVAGFLKPEQGGAGRGGNHENLFQFTILIF